MVESPHTLRIPPSAEPEDKKALVAFAKRHGLRNEYLKMVLKGEDKTLVGSVTRHPWQSLTYARWLMHSDTRELVVIVGGPSAFLRTERVWW